MNAPTQRKIQPVLSSLLEKRWVGWLFVSFSSVYLFLSLYIPFNWQCPFRAIFGIPCPACGLTTAVGALIKGDWRSALKEHAFAPVFLIGFMFLLFLVLLPEQYRKSWLITLGRFEMKTGFVFFLILAFVGYWIVRLAAGLI